MKVKARLLCRKGASEGIIQIIAHFKNQQKEISIGRKIPVSCWDYESGLAKGSEYDMLNVQIRNAIREVSAYIDALIATRQEVDLKKVFALVFKKRSATSVDDTQEKPVKLSEFIGDFIKENPDKISYGSMNNYRTLLSSLKDFRKDVLLKDVDVKFVNQYYNYLQNQGLAGDSILTRFKKLKKIIGTAITRGIVTEYPFGKGKLTISAGKQSKRKFLSQDELDTLVAYKPKNDSERKVMLVVLFNLHVGLRIGDVFTLRKHNVVEVNDPKRGLLYKLTKTTRKTETDVRTLLTQQAAEQVIRVGYHTKNEKDLLFDWLDEDDFKSEAKLYKSISAKTAYFNKVLYHICDHIGIKRISSHCLRHTFCTTLLRKGVPITSISKLVGHTDISTTMIYSQILEEATDEAIMALEM